MTALKLPALDPHAVAEVRGSGKRDAHRFVNRSQRPVRYLEIGNRIDGDAGFYPDDDLMWIETEEGTVAAHKDWRRY
jgi:uncharacterized cupin superfamily protein